MGKSISSRARPFLESRESQVSDAKVRELERALPSFRIEWKGGTILPKLK